MSVSEPCHCIAAASVPSWPAAMWRIESSLSGSGSRQQVEDLARGGVDIGEVRLHGGDVEVGPAGGRIGLEAAVRHGETLAVGHQPDLVRLGAAGRDLADPAVAVAASQMPSRPVPSAMAFSVVKSRLPSAVKAPWP